MADKLEAPQFYGEPQMGEAPTVPHSAGREARLEAAGIKPAQSLVEFQKEKAERAFKQNSVLGQQPVVEPTTEKNVVGHSAEKKEALKLMESEEITLQEALGRVKSGATKSRKSGKGK